MTATLTAPAGTHRRPAANGRGSLLRAEAHRFVSRRLLRLLVLLGVLGFAGALVLASTQYARPTAASLAEAQAQLDQIVAESQVGHAQCLTSADIPQGTSPEEFCGEPPTAENYGGAEQFLDKRPFLLREDGLTGVMAVAVATSALAFLVGASWIGAEWSSRSIVALLFWEPRRLRVMVTKLAVLAGATALLGTAAQAVWAAAARVLGATRGDTSVPADFWSTLAGAAGRGVLLTVLVGLLGYALANAVRNTAAAFGIGFVYFVLAENLVRAARPAWQEWLLTTNALALVQPGGASYFVYETFEEPNGVVQVADHEVFVSNLHGGLVLAAVTAVAVGVGVLLFSRRDLS